MKNRSQSKTQRPQSTLRKVWPFLWRQKSHFPLILFCIFIYSFTGRIGPLLVGYAIDFGIKKESLEMIYTVAIFFIISEFSRSIFSYLQNYHIRKLGHKILFDIREKLIHHIQRLKISYFDKTPIGRINTRMTNDIVHFGNLLNEGVTVIFVNTIELIAILFTLFYISSLLSFVTLFFVSFILIFTFFLSQKLRLLYREAKRSLSSLNAIASEYCRGMKVLQLYNLETYSQRRLASFARNYRKSQVKTIKLTAFLWPSIPFLNGLILILVLGVGALFHKALNLSLGDLSAFIILLRSFNTPIRIILENYSQYQDGLSSADRIFNFFKEPTEFYSKNKFAPQDKPPLTTKLLSKDTSSSEDKFPLKDFKGTLEIRNLNFKYNQNSPYVLKDINLKINENESVALIGRTGSGKSTLISLIQRFYDYNEGRILISGQELKTIPCDLLRSHIAVIQQDNYIFKGTILSNIQLNNFEFEKEKIKEIIQKAECQFLLEKKALRLDAKVEAGGVNLSQGERQLLSFMRVLVFPPSFLILDEATADMDSENEDLIQKAILKVIKEKTNLVIAHRLSTIKHCDRIFVLDKGQILEKNAHQIQ